MPKNKQKSSKNRIIIKCATCGKLKEIYLSRFKNNKSGYFFCSQECRYKSPQRLLTGFKDLTGQKFGKLTVLSVASNSSPGIIKWNCLCDCGNKKIIRGCHLKNGHTTSCGCNNKVKGFDNPRFQNLIGKKFGKLTVVDFYKFNNRGAIWKCQCDCNKVVYVARKELKNGDTKSCGCLKRKENNHKWISGGKYYGFDAAQKRIDFAEEIRQAKDNKSILEVKCAYCGKWFKPTKRAVSSRAEALEGKVSAENRFYCSKGCKESCPIYKKYKYPEGFKKATSREVVPELRQMCFERDDWMCQKCGSIENLHCHHIEGYTQNKMIANDLPNVITLCKKCHKEVHKLPGCHYHELRCDHIKDKQENKEVA